MKAKYTKRVYTFLRNGQPETVEVESLQGGVDLLGFTEERAQQLAREKYGEGAEYVGAQDFTTQVEVQVPG